MEEENDAETPKIKKTLNTAHIGPKITLDKITLSPQILDVPNTHT